MNAMLRNHTGCILAFGPFSKAIVPYLPFPAEEYEAVKANKMVATTLFEMPTVGMTERLVKALRFGRYEFGEHCFTKAAFPLFDWKEMEELGGDDVGVLKALADRGFTFLFLLKD